MPVHLLPMPYPYLSLSLFTNTKPEFLQDTVSFLFPEQYLQDFFRVIKTLEIHLLK